MASGPASHVKPVTKQTFGRALPGAAGEALPNGASVYYSFGHHHLTVPCVSAVSFSSLLPHRNFREGF